MLSWVAFMLAMSQNFWQAPSEIELRVCTPDYSGRSTLVCFYKLCCKPRSPQFSLVSYMSMYTWKSFFLFLLIEIESFRAHAFRNSNCYLTLTNTISICVTLILHVAGWLEITDRLTLASYLHVCQWLAQSNRSRNYCCHTRTTKFMRRMQGSKVNEAGSFLLKNFTKLRLPKHSFF